MSDSLASSPSAEPELRAGWSGSPTTSLGQRLRLGTRGSALALTQSGMVARALEAYHPGLVVELVPIKTTGDKITDVALAKIGDRGLFVKEIEQALLEGEVDFAVHSMKDMPTSLPEGLILACVPERLPPHDCMVSLQYARFEDLPPGARLATGSLRRRAQMLAARPDLALCEIRGNLPTRIRKLREQGLEATMLALSGLARLGVPGLVSGASFEAAAVEGKSPQGHMELPAAVRFAPGETPGTEASGESLTGEPVWIVPLDPLVCVPAVGQGALCLEACAQRQDVLDLLAPLHHAASGAAVVAERALMRTLEGGCQVPVGAWARLVGDSLHLDALLAAPVGAPLYRVHVEGDVQGAESLGIQAAEQLLAAGGDHVLRALRATSSS